MKKIIILLILLNFNQLLSQDSLFINSHVDSINTLWNAFQNQKKQVDSLIQKLDEKNNKLKIQEQSTLSQIEELKKLKIDITKTIISKSNGNSTDIPGTGLQMNWFIVVLIFVPFFMLFLFIIYLKYKQKRELRSHNDSFHQYLNDAKKMIEEMASELEKTTAESVEKAKSRVRILELIIAEAGQKIKPLNELTQKTKIPTEPKKPKSKDLPLPASSLSPNIFSRYKNMSKKESQPIQKKPKVQTPPAKETQTKQSTITPPKPTSKSAKPKENKAELIAGLMRKGLSITEIASKLNMSKGEIELILNIYKKRNIQA